MPTTTSTPIASYPPPRGAGWVVWQMLVLTALVVVAPWWHGQWPPMVSVGLGSALMLYAAWTGLAGVCQLGRNPTPSPVPRVGSELVTTGIYDRLRHPLYASMMALGGGWALLWSSTAGLALAVVLTIFLHAKARYEETLLHAAFPGYADYASRTPRYFPKL